MFLLIFKDFLYAKPEIISFKNTSYVFISNNSTRSKIHSLFWITFLCLSSMSNTLVLRKWFINLFNFVSVNQMYLAKIMIAHLFYKWNVNSSSMIRILCTKSSDKFCWNYIRIQFSKPVHILNCAMMDTGVWKVNVSVFASAIDRCKEITLLSIKRIWTCLKQCDVYCYLFQSTLRVE